MKTQRIISAILFTLFFGLTVTFAQNGGPCGNCQYHCQGNKGNRLNLTEEQQTKMDALRDTFRAEMKSIMNDENLTAVEKQEKLEKARDAHHDQVMALLTDEQKQNFDENFPPHWGRGAQMGKFGPGPKGYKFNNEAFMSVLKEKRAEFDSQLSTEEKTTINQARAVMKDHWEKMRNLEPGDMTFEERQQMREEMKKQLEPVYEIAENHKTELDAIHKEIRDEMMANCPAGGPYKGKGYRHGFGKGNMSERHDVHFLMMDPSSDSAFGEQSAVQDENLKLYPNPATSQLTIDFEVMKEGPVTIELLDKTGNVMQTIDKSERATGTASVNFDVGFLQDSEVYFIKVIMPGETAVQKFIKL